MTSFAAIAVPYIVIGAILDVIQVVYLSLLKARLNGVAVYLAWLENKLLVDILEILITSLVLWLPMI
jgi:hypothetical protein